MYLVYCILATGGDRGWSWGVGEGEGRQKEDGGRD